MPYSAPTLLACREMGGNGAPQHRSNQSSDQEQMPNLPHLAKDLSGVGTGAHTRGVRLGLHSKRTARECSQPVGQAVAGRAAAAQEGGTKERHDDAPELLHCRFAALLPQCSSCCS